MTWGIVFIIIAVAMAVGPIMMFRPTPYIRHLEALRSEAAKYGLKIRTVNYESRNQKKTVVVYSQPCETDFAVATLQRLDINHDIHFLGHWDWLNNQAPDLSSTQTENLKGFLNALPKSVIGVEFSPDSVGLWWLETATKKWGVAELRRDLDALKAIIVH